MSALFYYDGQWTDENPKLTGPADHAFWMSTVVFDGARSFDGLAPDLDLHCERVVRSARSMLLDPEVDADRIAELCREGIRKFPKAAQLYIRPMFFARNGFVMPEPGSTDFTLMLHEAPLPEPTGLSCAVSRFRRPARDMAPTDAKASCLYPNSQRALQEMRERGFDSAVMLDANGNVAELATANIWLVRGGMAVTPADNGTFLAGITRARVADLLRSAGITVEERAVTVDDLNAADEIFTTGNYGKVIPVTRFEARELQPGPVFRKAREMYFTYSESCPVM
ncbi:branched-chain amino acid aminotransferase [Marinibaculum pumilum]|uniref:Probable branched-chain-amino-acid aminotransferase n=1 Tax=Marinibaculum pumilum TaxID=1766165 RepID=A0ABV7L2Y4_9PROT